MKSKKNQVIPTPELLSEMQQLEVLGGTANDDIHIHAVMGCNVTYSGNCVTQCACKIDPTDPDPKG